MSASSRSDLSSSVYVSFLFFSFSFFGVVSFANVGLVPSSNVTVLLTAAGGLAALSTVFRGGVSSANLAL